MLQKITVEDYMAGSLTTFSPETDVLQAIHTLLELGISGAPVTDNLGNLVGMLSEKDCLRVALNAGYHGELGGTVADFMADKVTTVEAEQSVLDVAKLFLETPFKRFPVMKDNRLVGQISRKDILRALEAF